MVGGLIGHRADFGKIRSSLVDSAVLLGGTDPDVGVANPFFLDVGAKKGAAPRQQGRGSLTSGCKNCVASMQAFCVRFFPSFRSSGPFSISASTWYPGQYPADYPVPSVMPSWAIRVNLGRGFFFVSSDGA